MADKLTGERDVNIVRSHDEGDGTYSDAGASHNRGWDATDGAWNRLPVDHATGALKVYTSGSGVAGGGAATIADGADVAQGTTTDASSANTVVGILKAIKAAITGTVTTSESPPTTVTTGKTTVATAGTRVQLATNTAKSITLKALAANTGTMYVGNSAVASTNGFALAPGDTVSLDVSNSNVVWIDSSVNGEGVTWLVVN